MADLEGLLTYMEECGKKSARNVADATVREVRKILKPGYGFRTGRLKRGYRAIVTPVGGAVVQTDPRRSGKRPVWFYVEFGTKKMRARPHIRPALEIVKARYRKRMR
jgi:HK97 gp10 family phage protein